MVYIENIYIHCNFECRYRCRNRFCGLVSIYAVVFVCSAAKDSRTATIVVFYTNFNRVRLKKRNYFQNWLVFSHWPEKRNDKLKTIIIEKYMHLQWKLRSNKLIYLFLSIKQISRNHLQTSDDKIYRISTNAKLFTNNFHRWTRAHTHSQTVQHVLIILMKNFFWLLIQSKREREKNIALNCPMCLFATNLRSVKSN